MYRGWNGKDWLAKRFVVKVQKDQIAPNLSPAFLESAGLAEQGFRVTLELQLPRSYGWAPSQKPSEDFIALAT